MKWSALEDERCSIARTLAIIGDRWSLMVLRDCFLRVRRFDDFQQRLGITRHVLADRLKQFVDAGVLARVAYQDRPVRHEYVLTQKGRDLYPVLMAMARWGDVHMDDGAGAPLLYRHNNCGCHFHAVACCSACGEALDPRAVTVEPGPGLNHDEAAALTAFASKRRAGG